MAVQKPRGRWPTLKSTVPTLRFRSVTRPLLLWTGHFTARRNKSYYRTTSPRGICSMPRGFVFLSLFVALPSAWASGHGPVFGLATPTNPKNGWSLDLGFMGRNGQVDSGAMFRGMLGYGIT